MRLKQYLNELSVKKGTNIDIAKKAGEFFNARIQLEDGTTWLYNATAAGKGEHRTWIISFYDPDGKEIKDRHKIALETFAAVEKVTAEFIKWGNPQRIDFSAGGASRTKLYKLLAKKIQKAGYEFEEETILGGVGYKFTKK